eukprot:jgi/Psemu1/300027/fgenesh1_kg.5_\
MGIVFAGTIVFLLICILLPGCCEAWAVMPSGSIPASTQCVLISGHRGRRGLSVNRSNSIRSNMIGTGFSFEDGEQILVSVQKPFGIVLEQGGGTRTRTTTNTDDDGEEESSNIDTTDSCDGIVVTEVDPNGSAGRAGVRTGDVLVAVQNASTVSADLTEVLDFIANKCPRVVNLRFQRPL